MGAPLWHTEYYGVDIYSKMRITLTMIFEQFAYTVGDFLFEPFYFVPWRQYN